MRVSIIKNNIVGSLIFLTLAILSLQLIFTAKASAISGWTTVYDYGGSVALLCKTAENGGYGPVWKVTVASLSSPGTYTNNHVRIYRNGTEMSRISVRAENGQWKLGYIYGSQIFNDGIWAVGSSAAGAGFLGNLNGTYSISNLANCG